MDHKDFYCVTQDQIDDCVLPSDYMDKRMAAEFDLHPSLSQAEITKAVIDFEFETVKPPVLERITLQAKPLTALVYDPYDMLQSMMTAGPMMDDGFEDDDCEDEDEPEPEEGSKMQYLRLAAPIAMGIGIAQIVLTAWGVCFAAAAGFSAEPWAIGCVCGVVILCAGGILSLMVGESE